MIFFCNTGLLREICTYCMPDLPHLKSISVVEQCWDLVISDLTQSGNQWVGFQCNHCQPSSKTEPADKCSLSSICTVALVSVRCVKPCFCSFDEDSWSGLWILPPLQPPLEVFQTSLLLGRITCFIWPGNTPWFLREMLLGRRTSWILCLASCNTVTQPDISDKKWIDGWMIWHFLSPSCTSWRNRSYKVFIVAVTPQHRRISVVEIPIQLCSCRPRCWFAWAFGLKLKQLWHQSGITVQIHLPKNQNVYTVDLQIWLSSNWKTV